MLRLRLRNPEPRPLLVAASFDAWAGRIEPRPGVGYLYMEPEGTASLDLPVRLIKPEGEPPLRLDLRLRELHASLTPAYQKLYVSDLPTGLP